VSSAQTIEISQGRFVGRPSILFVVAQTDDQGRITVKVAGDASLFARGQLDI
jgi:predicted PhzF superfamily epimerase YddE/YHI9